MILKKKKNDKTIDIPTINRDGSLKKRLFPLMMGGFLNILDKKSKLYTYLLVRLVDKAFDEYFEAKEYIEEEIKTGDKLTYMFGKINHLENCLNAISRAGKIFKIIVSGKIIKKDGVKKVIKKKINIINFFNPEDIEEIKKSKNKESTIRNRIEHINEDVYFNKFKQELSINVDEEYRKICINKKSITLIELVEIIEKYYEFVLGIFGNLPNRIEKGVYFYDKK